MASSYVSGPAFFGNARRWHLVQMIRCLLADPRKGVTCPETGQRYVFLSARQAAEELGCNRDTAAAELKKLADADHLERTKLGGEGIKPNGTKCSPGVVTWFYRLGTVLPEWFQGIRNAVRRMPADHCPRPGQSIQETPLRNSFPKGGASAKEEQPYAIPGHEATQELIKRQEQMVFVPAPGVTVAKAEGDTSPPETHETKPVNNLTPEEQKAVDERAKTMSKEEALQILNNDDLFLPDDGSWDHLPKPEHKILVEAAFQVDGKDLTPKAIDWALDRLGVRGAAAMAQADNSKPKGFGS